MIIGVTGHAQHGKDTTGNFLVEKYGFTKYGFADQLKSMALTLDPWILGASVYQRVLFLGNEDDMYARLSYIVDQVGWEEAKRVPEIRRFLQVLGTEGVRGHIGDDSWVRALERKITENHTWTFIESDASILLDDVVITDVRFPNEAQAIRRWGGQLWRVRRYNFDNGLGLDHPSEQFVDHLRVDATFCARDVPDLHRQIAEEMKRCYVEA